MSVRIIKDSEVLAKFFTSSTKSYGSSTITKVDYVLYASWGLLRATAQVQYRLVLLCDLLGWGLLRATAQVQ